jgi:hypothetical protein
MTLGLPGLLLVASGALPALILVVVVIWRDEYRIRAARERRDRRAK